MPVSWSEAGSIATVLYSVAFLVALCYAALQVHEMKKTRSAQLYLALHELSARDATWDTLVLIERLDGLTFEEFRAATTKEEADALFRLCFLFCGLGHMVAEGYLDRRVVFEWAAPFVIVFRNRMDHVIWDLRRENEDLLLYFDWLAHEAADWDAKHRDASLRRLTPWRAPCRTSASRARNPIDHK